MSSERRLRLLRRLTSDGEFQMAGLCLGCAEVLDLSGAGVMLMGGSSPQASLCTSNDVSAVLEDLQYSFGEGPCLDAHRSDRPVVAADLDADSGRWPMFSPPALDAGARAVFGFPLRVGAARLGALNLYRDASGPLTDDQHADALVLAEVTALAVLSTQAGAPPGTVAATIVEGADFRLVVHQAAGMVAVQTNSSIDDALARLRGHAIANDVRLVDLARDVVERRVRLEPEPINDP